MSKLIILIQNSIINLVKIYGIHKYIFLNSIIGISCLPIVANPNEIHSLGVLLTLIINSIAVINFTYLLIKPDLEDGTLDLLLIIESTHIIALSKIIGLYCVVAVAELVTIPLMSIIFQLTWKQSLVFTATQLLLLVQVSSIAVLISAIQSYFRINNHFIVILVMPFIVPGLIISGLLVEYYQNLSYLFMILTGLSLIIMPVCTAFISYLINNIYNN